MRNLFLFRTKAFMLTVIFLIGISGILCAQPIAIIDAGSSGSRLFVYNIDNRKQEIQLLYNETGGRLSDVVSDAVAGSFLKEITKNYPETSGEKIPLYILATAGMRLDKAATDPIYTRIRSKANEINPKFDFKQAMTISGQYEGLYAWIAVNYKENKLRFGPSGWNCAADSYGILEIGGASMQIAFAATGIRAEDRIAHKNLQNIYSKSYLGGGVDQIFMKYNTNPGAIPFGKLENVSGLYPRDIQFLGLGKPIGIVLANPFKSYDRSEDSMGNYHPWMTDYYIKAVIPAFNLTGKLSTPGVQSSWTEGAALDIMLNGQDPQPFVNGVETML